MRDLFELELSASDLISAYRLSTQKFAQMLDDPTQCYKFYWFQALVTLSAGSDRDISFDEAADEMILDAWHSVTRYHLRLGPVIAGKCENRLEAAIRIAAEAPGLSDSPSREEIRRAIRRQNPKLRQVKTDLMRYVPYRLLSPFVTDKKLLDAPGRLNAFIDEQNRTEPVPYSFAGGTGLERTIRFHPAWRALFRECLPVISGWIELKKVRFLQDRNPGVPGIIYKLSRENASDRKLQNARKLWNTAAAEGVLQLSDLYSGTLLAANDYDLDHFVPWSYIASDELWNLAPAEKGLNRSKSNSLADWNHFFPVLAEQQFSLCCAVHENDAVRQAFESCRRDNINAVWASESLYSGQLTQTEFTGLLEEHLKPVYDAARLQGYSLWQPELF